jgi:phosphate transport system protein
MELEHTSRDFETELRDLRSRTTQMGARSERCLALALDVVWQGSAELAAQVRDLEALTDDDEVDITAMVVRLLALRQPLARDLRFLTATLKLVTDLERISDEAGHIAKRAMEEPAQTRSLAREELEPMAGRAQQALRDALHSFFDEDPSRADQALASSDVVHEQYNAVVARLSDRMAKRSADVVGGMLIIRVAKHLERIAGHAASVAEEAVFFVRGEYVRHDRTGSRSLP